MTQKKVVFIPLLSNYIPKVESFLSKQASQGWIVEEIDWRGIHFTKRSPRNRQYVFYKLAGLRKQMKLDHDACRIADGLTSSFPATNTINVKWGSWYLVSFVSDNNLSEYHGLLNRRDQFLLHDALAGIGWSCAFLAVSLGMLALYLTDTTRKDALMTFSLILIVAVVGIVKETDACIHFYRRLHKK